jgi:hypothetical protein
MIILIKQGKRHLSFSLLFQPDVLDALTANIKNFPSTARHITDQTLQLCLSCLDGTKDIEKETIEKSNICMVTLYSIKSGNSSDQWKECVLRLISSIHQCLNRLFDTVDEGIYIDSV